MPSRRAFSARLTVVATSTGLGFWGAALAQAEFPNRAIKYVVPFPAGGLTDVMARLMAQKLGEALKQPVVVENKAGANANLGADFVAKSPADGYTWLAVTLAHAVNASLFSHLPYSLEKNLLPVVHLASSPLVLVVNASHPAKNLKEFLERARAPSAQPLSAGSSGNGTPPHLGLELLAGAAKLTVTHVPYKGGAPSMNDLMGGQLDFVVSNLPECAPFIKAGKLRALAVTSLQRHPLLPDVPTFAELGLPDMELENWTGLMVPAGTPKAIVDKVAIEALRAVKSPEVVERVGLQGFTVTGLGPAEFSAIVQKDMARWREVIKARNIKAD
jgi:tripartite-type tricarboxylate transporter receptor subunit TctC